MNIHPLNRDSILVKNKKKRVGTQRGVSHQGFVLGAAYKSEGGEKETQRWAWREPSLAGAPEGRAACSLIIALKEPSSLVKHNHVWGQEEKTRIHTAVPRYISLL